MIAFESVPYGRRRRLSEKASQCGARYSLAVSLKISMASINNSDLSQTASTRIITAADKVKENATPWSEIETDARELANALRSKDESGEYTLSNYMYCF